jgi:hypothetical protein
VTRSNVPGNVDTPMYLTAKPTLEWIGSAAYVPLRGVV